jgi:hypothetical protein
MLADVDSIAERRRHNPAKFSIPAIGPWGRRQLEKGDRASVVAARQRWQNECGIKRTPRLARLGFHTVTRRQGVRGMG